MEPPALRVSDGLPKRARKIRRLLKRPKSYTKCTATECLTYGFLPRKKCQRRIARTARRVCNPWRRFVASRSIKPPQNQQPAPSNPDTHQPSPVAGAQFFRPGINAIADTGIPTGPASSWVFLGTGDQDLANRVAFRRCRPNENVYLRVNFDAVATDQKAAARQIVSRALQHIADQSGVTLVLQGETSQRYSDQIADHRPGGTTVPRYVIPDDDTDIWIDFAFGSEDPSGYVMGRGGNIYSFQASDQSLVNRITGAYATVRAQRPGAASPADFYNVSSPIGVYPLLLHELGHAMGLGHVGGQADDVVQIMYPALSPGMPYVQYQAGDRQGLRTVGSGACG